MPGATSARTVVLLCGARVGREPEPLVDLGLVVGLGLVDGAAASLTERTISATAPVTSVRQTVTGLRRVLLTPVSGDSGLGDP